LTLACVVLAQNAVRETEFVDIVCDGSLAETILKYGTVGRSVTVIGNEHAKQFRKRDGSPGFTNEIYALELDLGAEPNQAQE
jgi:single-stranded DNA-binding protein